MPSEQVKDSDFDASGIVFNPGEPVTLHGLSVNCVEARFRVEFSGTDCTSRIIGRTSAFNFIRGRLCLRVSIATSESVVLERGLFYLSFYSPGRDMWMTAVFAFDGKQDVVDIGMPLGHVSLCEWRASLPAGTGGTELVAREMGFVKVDGEWVDLLEMEVEHGEQHGP